MFLIPIWNFQHEVSTGDVRRDQVGADADSSSTQPSLLTSSFSESLGTMSASLRFRGSPFAALAKLIKILVAGCRDERRRLYFVIVMFLIGHVYFFQLFRFAVSV